MGGLFHAVAKVEELSCLRVQLGVGGEGVADLAPTASGAGTGRWGQGGRPHHMRPPQKRVSTESALARRPIGRAGAAATRPARNLQQGYQLPHLQATAVMLPPLLQQLTRVWRAPGLTPGRCRRWQASMGGRPRAAPAGAPRGRQWRCWQCPAHSARTHTHTHTHTAGAQVKRMRGQGGKDGWMGVGVGTGVPPL